MNKNTELVKRTKVEGTPFTIITTPDGGSVVTLGKYRVSAPMETEEEARLYVMGKDWNLILSVVMLMVEEETTKHQKLNDTIEYQKRKIDETLNKQKTNKEYEEDRKAYFNPQKNGNNKKES